jgi:alpha-glucosidase
MNFHGATLPRGWQRTYLERRTSSAFELALAVLFTSGIQHYAEIPEGMARAPEYVREFLRGVPSIWDDVRFLTGDPGKYVAIARRSGNKWYIGGINAERTRRDFVLDLASLGPLQTATLIADGGQGNLTFKRTDLEISKSPATIEVQGRGGFVIEAPQK